MPAYMRRYTARLLIFMGSYVAILVGGLTFARGGDPAQGTLVALALLTAAPIIGVFWAIFRLLAECDDEYQRLLLVKQTLLATAITLAISTVWQFLVVYDVIDTGLQWIGAIWFAMFGIAAPIVRRKA